MNLTTTTTPETVVPFSRQIREATTIDHGEAEHSPFMSALADGRATRESFASYMVQQYLVYDALEMATACMVDDPVAGAFVFPELNRVASLRDDLRVLCGAEWEASLVPTDATRGYVQRLEEVAADWPGGFVAHHYTRYMGDLSGGAFIGRIVTEQFGLERGGASFYTFEGVPDAKAFKAEYRRRLDAVPWDRDGREAVVSEVHRAYQHNWEVLASIE